MVKKRKNMISKVDELVDEINERVWDESAEGWFSDKDAKKTTSYYAKIGKDLKKSPPVIQ